MNKGTFLVVASISILSAVAPRFADAAESFVAFESGPVRPLALSPSKSLLFAANTPDNRVEIFRVTDAGLERAGDVVVGLEPVAIAARTESEIYVVNHLSDSISVVNVSDPARAFVKTTLLVGDEPRDVVIAGAAHDKVYVTAAHRGQNRPGDPQLTTPGVGRADVWVFDATNLGAAPKILSFFCDTPRALAVTKDGTKVYAAAFHSGNRSTVLEELAVTKQLAANLAIGDGFTGLGLPAPLTNTQGVAAPETSLIVKFDGTKWRDSANRDWTPRVRFSLPDKDLFEIDATQDPPTVTRQLSGTGTILFNIAVNPATGAVYVSNLESQNQLRFEPTVHGHVAENRVTIVNGASITPVHLNPHIDYSGPGNPAEIAQSLAFPVDMEFTADGSTLFVAAFGSRKVAVLDANAAVVGRIDVGGGPSGLALDEPRERLYVLNRFDQTISIVNTRTRAPSSVVALRYDPEPVKVRAGRPVLYDATRSGHGDASCASCHIFGDFDSLAWDLGDPNGQVEANPIMRVDIQGNSPLSDFHPMKGPMTTQSLRGMAGAGAMHWRGDRNGGAAAPFSEEEAFLAFRPAFQGLLGMTSELPLSEMEKFRDFILAVQYPPNPIANLDGTLTTQQAAGKQVFDSNGSRTGLGGDGDPCASCHAMPFGTDGHGSLEGLTQDFKVAHLRNLYQKVGMFGSAVPHIASDSPFALESAPTPNQGDQVRGFGFLNDGSVPTLFNFFRFPLRQFTFPDAPGRSGAQKIRELESFLLAFYTGLAPCVGQQVTLDASNIDLVPSPQLNRYNLLRARADAGDCDLVVHGPTSAATGLVRGFLYKGAGAYDTDRAAESTTEGALAALIRSQGAVLTATAVPPGSGRRIAVDRDEDGWPDLDEIESGSDPADPLSVPGREFQRGNCNGDSKLDLSDSVFTLGYLFTGGPASPCGEACDSNGDATVDISDAVYTLVFLFGGGNPPGLYPACEPSSASCASTSVCP